MKNSEGIIDSYKQDYIMVQILKIAMRTNSINMKE